MTVVLGIDQSLAHSGLVWLGPGLLGWRQVDTGKLKGAERLVFIKDNVDKVVSEQQPGLVVMEGYAYGAVGKVFELGELGGVLKTYFAEKRIPLLVVAPVQLKKFLTGNHQASKLEVVTAVNERLHLSWKEKDNNLADAAALALVGTSYLEEDANITKRCEMDVIVTLRKLTRPTKKRRVKRKHKFHKI